MKSKKICALILAVIAFFGMVSCSNGSATSDAPPSAAGQIYLYGEWHGIDAILEKEFEIWRDHYNRDGMRHLFMEMPYYAAEFLNIWMHSDL